MMSVINIIYTAMLHISISKATKTEHYKVNTVLFTPNNKRNIK